MVTEENLDIPPGKAVKESAHRFCGIALKMGFINERQYRDALEEQISNSPFARLRPRRRIGEILQQKNWLTCRQLEMILEKLQEK